MNEHFSDVDKWTCCTVYYNLPETKFSCQPNRQKTTLILFCPHNLYPMPTFSAKSKSALYEARQKVRV